MLLPSSLVWTKNVKREKGNAWAYMEHNTGDVFYLNFSNHFKTSALKAQPGELIMLFQSINKHPPGYPRGTYITHLITPIDKILYEVGGTHPFARLVGVVSKPPSPLPTSETNFSFFKPNRGALCRLDRIEHKKVEMTLENKQFFFWNKFPHPSSVTFSNLEAIINEPNDPESDISVQEGLERYALKKHKYYERSSSVVIQKKQRAIATGQLKCEVCEFEFKKRYPCIGDGYIECHHKIPIASGGIRETKLEDLALVCSNCHRMLHRRLDGKYLTIEQLRSIIKHNPL